MLPETSQSSSIALPRWPAAATLLLGLGAWSGCGGSAPAPTAAAPAAVPSPAAAASPSPAVGQSAPAAAPTRSTATKWIGGIPYDVFYDRPLEVASDQTSLVAAAAVPSTPAAAVPAAAVPAAAPAASAAPMPSAAPATATGGELDWAKIAPIEILVEEVTAVRNDLQAKLNTLADYNKNWETVDVDATELAAIAGVIERHPGDVSWKPNAKIARKLAEQINASATKTGRSDFDATKGAYDSLVDTLNGNAPAGVEADDMAPFGDFADRSTLMERLEATLSFAKSNITTQQRLEEDPAAIKRKMTVLATLMSVVGTPGYDSTAEAEYQGFIKTFVDGALSGRDAVDAKNLEAFTEAVNTMQKACNDCHLKYKFDGSSF